MALIGAMNQRDPRFQEALLRSTAGGPKNNVGISKRVTAAHTDREMGQRLAFAQLAERQRAFRDSMKLANKRLRFNKRYARQSLHDKRQDLNRTMGLGLLTAGFGFLEGRRRAELRDIDREARNKFYRKMSLMDYSKMPDWGAGEVIDPYAMPDWGK